MNKELTLKDIEEMFKMEQELDVSMKDRFHNTLTPEQLSTLTAPKGSYPEKREEKCETDYSILEAKLAKLAKLEELEARYKK